MRTVPPPPLRRPRLVPRRRRRPRPEPQPSRPTPPRACSSARRGRGPSCPRVPERACLCLFLPLLLLSFLLIARLIACGRGVFFRLLVCFRRLWLRRLSEGLLRGRFRRRL